MYKINIHVEYDYWLPKQSMLQSVPQSHDFLQKLKVVNQKSGCLVIH